MNLKHPVKNIMIFGDSYSTFAGHIPAGYAPYYPNMEEGKSDVMKVEETWWYPLCEELSLNLVMNDSFSGSTLCNTGYQGDCSKTNSFIFRMERYEAAGFFREHDIDTVFIFGCTNDSWANAPLGELKMTGIEKEELFSVRPAIAYFVGKLRTLLPEANIIFLVNNQLKPEIEETVRAVSEHFGTSYLTFENIDKISDHPTIKGMAEIKDRVKEFLLG